MDRPTVFLLSLAVMFGVAVALESERRGHASLSDRIGSLSHTQVVAVAGILAIALIAAWNRWTNAAGKTLLIDFQCFTVPDRLKIGRRELIDAMKERGVFTEENIRFQEKVLERSGLGDATGLSDGINAMREGPLSTTLQSAIDETQEVIFSVVEDLLKKTNTPAEKIDIVMVSCSCFAPTPSMAAMLVNRFKMRTDVLTYNLSGMGCSSSLVCVDLAKHMLKAMPGSMALIVNHENITQNWYLGNDRSMLVCNCLFRVGGAAALVSNRPQDFGRAKYELETTLRTHLGCYDDAYGCMGVAEDVEGKQGVFLRKNVIAVAGRALKTNITSLAPRVFPIYELAKCAMDKTYTPSFGKYINHFLLHTGGRGVLDDLELNLKLTSKQAQPAKDTLYRFGNTSAASTWYILANIESTSGVQKGDRLWQLGFGGGFKCNSAIWRARRNVHEVHECWK